MKIGVIGSGISGLTCALLLSSSHEVTLYERESRLGGHTNTVPMEHEGKTLSIDTGFIVFNERNYPMFCRLLKRLGVESRPTTMSFSVRDEASGFEYGGSSLGGAVGGWSNLLNPRWWRVMRGIYGLGRTGKELLRRVGRDETIGDLCDRGVWSRGFLDDCLLPMGGAIWSAPRDAMLRFPARFFLRFFDNHGMLNLRERPMWRTIVGGSSRYIDAMMRSAPLSVRTNAPVESILRHARGVRIALSGGASAEHEHIIIATHSDQALSLLGDASSAEREVLSAMPYQRNEAVLHTDERMLPRRRRCWAAWNYRTSADPSRPVSVTYNMSMLQGLDTRAPVCVTLNASEPLDPARVIAHLSYEHPLYTATGESARARWSEISGPRNTHFCGAYWGNGFHEDGVASALRVCKAWGVEL